MAIDPSTLAIRGSCLARWALVLVLLGLCPASFAQRAAPVETVEVEAAFLVNFLRYTQWPQGTFPTTEAPYVVTVVGSPQAVEGVRAVARAASRVGGRPIEVLALSAARGALSAPIGSTKDRENLARLRSSHLVYFHSSAGNVLPDQALADLWGQPVLTVSNLPGFTTAGGMLGLVKASDHIVFEANPGAIRHAGLLVSAKVLKLARLRQGGVQ